MIIAIRELYFHLSIIIGIKFCLSINMNYYYTYTRYTLTAITSICRLKIYCIIHTHSHDLCQRYLIIRTMHVNSLHQFPKLLKNS